MDGLDEAPILALLEQLARDARRPPDEHVIQTVAIYVCHGKGRSLA